MKRIFILIGFLAQPAFVFAQATITVGDQVLELARTDQGCGIYATKQPNYPGVTVNNTYQWSGRCVSGAAEGFGNLKTLSSTNGASPSIITTTGHRRAGISIGHSTTEFASSGSSISFWAYEFSGRGVGSVSWGAKPFLSVNPDLHNTTSISLPNVAKDIPLQGDRPRQVVRGSTESVTIAKQPCSLLKGKLAFCDGESTGLGKQAAVVTVMRIPSAASDMEARRAAMQAQQVFPCPNPTNFEGCQSLFLQKAQPVIDEIMDFIRSTKSLVENEIANTPK